jgi:hypothetical protein
MTPSVSYDVLVVGGGVAGVAAALESSRRGLRTAIIEKTVLFGGLATSGLVPVYMPLCDGHGRQVTFGIAEELLKASIRYGPGRIPSAWLDEPRRDEAMEQLYPQTDFAKRYMVPYAPAAFALGLDETLDESEADLWLDTLACTPTVSSGRVTGVEVENKSGLIALAARCTIDATGDSDIAFRAGAPCTERGSYPSMLYQYSSLERARQAVEKGSAARLVTWRGGGGANELDTGYDGPSGKFSGCRGKDVSAFLVESRRIMRRKLAAEQAEAAEGDVEGRENLYPASLPTMHQIRMTRMIDGQETVRDEARNTRVDSSVGVIADCRQSGVLWEVPYGSLLPRAVGNLLAVGRCVASEEYSWQVTRLIQSAALTGQVAAIAAALAIGADTSPELLDVADVQTACRDRGLLLHI